jgi:hypothetical protein
MKGTRQARDLDFDEEEDARRIHVFEKGDGKKWFEAKIADKLAPHEGNLIDIKS